MIALKFLAYIWQLPQHVVALFTLYILNRKRFETSYVYRKGVYFVRKVIPKSGLTLGNYTLLYPPFKYYPKAYKTQSVIKHETGHSKQSLILGPTYLPVLIFVKAFNFLCVKILHRSWDAETIRAWQKGLWLERWADKLGGLRN